MKLFPKRWRRIGIAIGESGVAVVESKRTFPHRLSVSILYETGNRVARLGEAELREELETVADQLVESTFDQRLSVDVAILPRVNQTKALRLPPLPRDSLRALLERGAARFFVSDQKGCSILADAVRLPARTRSDRQSLASIAPVWLVESIHESFVSRGIRVGRVVPGLVAAARALRRLAAGQDRRGVDAVLTFGSTVQLATITSGRLSGIRSIPRSALVSESTDALNRSEALDALDDESGGTGARSGSMVCCRLIPGIHALEILEWTDSAETLPGDGRAEAVLCAFGAVLRGADQGEFKLPIQRDRERRTERWTTAATAACALGLFASAAGLNLLDLERERSAVEAHLAVTSDGANEARRASATITALDERIAAIVAADRARHSWSELLEGLAETLPPDTHLHSLRSESAGSVRLEGMSGAMPGLLAALAERPTFAQVRLTGTGQGDGSEGAERFSLVAMLGDGPSPTEDRRDSERSSHIVSESQHLLHSEPTPLSGVSIEASGSNSP